MTWSAANVGQKSLASFINWIHYTFLEGKHANKQSWKYEMPQGFWDGDYRKKLGEKWLQSDSLKLFAALIFLLQTLVCRWTNEQNHTYWD